MSSGPGHWPWPCSPRPSGPRLSAWADRRGRHKSALLVSVAVGAGGLPAPGGRALPAARPVVLGEWPFQCRLRHGGHLHRQPARDDPSGRMADRSRPWASLRATPGRDRAGDRQSSWPPTTGSVFRLAGGLRAAFAFTGAWWILFSLPAALARFGRPRRRRARRDRGRRTHRVRPVAHRGQGGRRPAPRGRARPAACSCWERCRRRSPSFRAWLLRSLARADARAAGAARAGRRPAGGSLIGMVSERAGRRRRRRSASRLDLSAVAAWFVERVPQLGLALLWRWCSAACRA